MKRLICVALCALLVLLSVSVYAVQEPVTAVQAAAEVRLGGEIHVSVVLQGPDVYQAAGVRLLYDAEAFTLCEAGEGHSPTSGVVLFVASGNSQQYVFEATFRANREGTFFFAAEEAMLADTDVYELPYARQNVTVGNYRCDCNGDGLVDTTDLLLLKKCLAGLIDENEIESDVDGNGVVDTADLLILKKSLAGLI